jgi:hypothetical protein
MTEVMGRVLTAPKIQYGGRVSIHFKKSFSFILSFVLDKSYCHTKSRCMGYAW